MRSWRMYLVSLGGAIGGISRSSRILTVCAPAGSREILRGALVRFPGAVFQC
jgi:hypothetical protein